MSDWCFKHRNYFNNKMYNTKKETKVSFTYTYIYIIIINKIHSITIASIGPIKTVYFILVLYQYYISTITIVYYYNSTIIILLLGYTILDYLYYTSIMYSLYCILYCLYSYNIHTVYDNVSNTRFQVYELYSQILFNATLFNFK